LVRPIYINSQTNISFWFDIGLRLPLFEGLADGGTKRGHNGEPDRLAAARLVIAAMLLVCASRSSYRPIAIQPGPLPQDTGPFLRGFAEGREYLVLRKTQPGTQVSI
jgi:hypothetical protein